jgi:hypothetical protein
MKFVSGRFKAQYCGKEVDPLRLRTVSHLHYLNIGSIAVLENANWVTDYHHDIFPAKSIGINHIQHVDIFFDSNNNQAYSIRESLRQCILLNPDIHSITRKGNYTYGIIEGQLLGTIGEPVNPVIKHEMVSVEDNFHSITPIPISIQDAREEFRLENVSSWSWGSFFERLFLILPIIFGLIWLLTHRGCSRIPKLETNPLELTDSITLRSDNDSLIVQNGLVTFSAYDWKVQDNDTVSLWMNGVPMIENLGLSKTPATWTWPPLPQGKNMLTIKSINDGALGPASPTIEVNDGKITHVFIMEVYKGKPQKIYLINK